MQSDANKNIESEFYIVTESGDKIPVEYSVSEDEYCPFHQTVALYSNNTILKDVWIIELNHIDYLARKKDLELEFIKELKYYHKPTKEEVLWAMSKYGLTRGDVAIVKKAYEVDIEMD